MPMYAGRQSKYSVQSIVQLSRNWIALKQRVYELTSVTGIPTATATRVICIK